MLEQRVSPSELRSVLDWLLDSGFNVTSATTLPSGETDLTIRLPR